MFDSLAATALAFALSIGVAGFVLLFIGALEYSGRARRVARMREQRFAERAKRLGLARPIRY